MKFIYKITNQINGKVYVGQTYDLAQRRSQHLREGKLEGKLKRPLYCAMRKHDIENFIFEVIEECLENIVDEREIYWISTLDSMNPEKGYNLTPGGDGWSINHNEPLCKEKNHRAAISMNKRIWSDSNFRSRNRERIIDQTRKLFSEGKMHAPDWTGRKHRDETKVAIGNANSVHQRGDGNSQFGLAWISNEIEQISKKVRKDELQLWIDRGWIKGRKMKW